MIVKPRFKGKPVWIYGNILVTFWFVMAYKEKIYTILRIISADDMLLGEIEVFSAWFLF